LNRKPGADITDYFNYGFNEETWRAYCERQKRLRINESCVGLTGLTVLQNPMNVDQKQQGINIGIKRIGRQKPPGTIDVIGASSSSQMNNIRPQAPRENVIQVMTADRREYSRTVVGNQQGGVGGFNPPNESYYNNDQQDAYNYGYEPTQEQQWDHQNVSSNWAPREIKELTGHGNQPQPMMNIPPPSMHVPNMMQGHNNMMPQMGGSGSSLKPLMNDPRDRRDPNPRGDNRNYDRKRMRSNSRERDQRDRKDRRERERSPDRSGGDRRKRRSRSRERDLNRREPMRSKSRERKRSKSKDRSKDRKSDDRRGESKMKSTR
jgi:pre-mRNA 3'-end-processing factor FIP1